MKAAIYLLGLVGVALFTCLVVRQGIREVGNLLATAKWGLLGITLFHLLPMAADTISWWKLFPPGHRLRLRRLLWMRWLGESVNNLLPAAQVGGDLLRARLAALQDAPLSRSAATVMVDLTAGVFTQAIFTVLGLALLVFVIGGTSLTGPILLVVLIGLISLGGFYSVQRIGIFRILRVIVSRLSQGTKWQSFIVNGAIFDREVHATYGRRRAVAASIVWRFISWIVGSGEVWLALHALGVPVNFAEALILESMGQAVRGATFLVPGAIGFQEGGLVVVGALLNIPAEAALALSLIKRVRELSQGIPGLVVWQIVEGRQWWAPSFRVKRRAHSSPPS